MAGYLRSLPDKLRGFRARFPALLRALGLAWTAAPGWTMAWGLLLAILGVLPVATVYLTRTLVDALAAAPGAGGTWDTLRLPLLLVVLLAGLALVTEFLRAVAAWVCTAQAEHLRDYVSDLIHRKSVVADLAFYESPSYYDHLHRARTEAGGRPAALLESVGSVLQSGLTLCAMCAVLIPFGVWLPAVLLLNTVPALAVVVHFSHRQYQWRQRATADERRSCYYDWLLTAGEAAAEVRLFGLGDLFRTAYQTLREGLRRERLRLAGQEVLAELGAATYALLVTGAAMGWMVWQTLQGRATLGDLVLFYLAFQQGQRLLHTLLRNVGQLYANSLFLGDLFEFLALEEQVVSPAQPRAVPAHLQDGIRFRRVTFRYPGSQRCALHDFDLFIPAGRTVALVGLNGAGKSTVIKLLCRFYDPDEGRIEFDGVDLRALQLEEHRRRITVLFQQPVHYSATAGENISLGDAATVRDAADVSAAAGAAGADEVIARLPQGYDQPLGKWFTDGTELSVGEWQRLALARAFLRPTPLLLLDEPTSAMDSWAEADWLGRLGKLADGRTALIITHRFTTALHADIIHVMGDGRVVESGSHRELVAQGGRYAQAWAAQLRQTESPCP